VCRVLIIEDQIGEQFLDAFGRLNEDRLPIPDGLSRPKDVTFKTILCRHPKELDRYLRGTPDWDAFIIDKRFIDGDREPQHLAQKVLESLRDLGVAGLRIICTAYPEPEDAVQCMRLGAWDYIDKTNPRHGSAIIDVAVSLLEGLRSIEKAALRTQTDQKGRQFIAENFDRLSQKYKGQFVAVGKSGGSEDWDVVAADESLFGVYVKLDKAGVDRQSAHFTLIRE